MPTGTDSQNFARAFGAAIDQFLSANGMSQADAVRTLGLEINKGKARLNTYCRGRSDGTWPVPDAEILYLLCSKLGFSFQYNGYEISANSFKGGGSKRMENPVEQLAIRFDSQFNLTDEKGTVSINVKRPVGRIEVALSLRGVS